MSNKKFKSLICDSYGCFNKGSVFKFDKCKKGKNLYTFKYDFYNESKRVWAYCEELSTRFIELTNKNK